MIRDGCKRINMLDKESVMHTSAVCPGLLGVACRVRIPGGDVVTSTVVVPRGSVRLQMHLSRSGILRLRGIAVPCIAETRGVRIRRAGVAVRVTRVRNTRSIVS